jgi:hypothetical protein
VFVATFMNKETNNFVSKVMIKLGFGVSFMILQTVFYRPESKTVGYIIYVGV